MRPSNWITGKLVSTAFKISFEQNEAQPTRPIKQETEALEAQPTVRTTTKTPTTQNRLRCQHTKTNKTKQKQKQKQKTNKTKQPPTPELACVPKQESTKRLKRRRL
ncbi:hypothetical protein AAHH84_00225 [Candidatus Hodgkinia cicadicola]